MYYSILHYENLKKISEYTLQATNKTTLKAKTTEAINQIKFKGMLKVYYFNNIEALNNFNRNVFRLQNLL